MAAAIKKILYAADAKESALNEAQGLLGSVKDSGMVEVETDM